MKKQDIYNWCALALVLLGEYFAILGIQHQRPVWWILAVGVICIFLILWFTGIKPKRRAGTNSLIITKLLANAIAPRPISTVYLLVFVIHLGWLSNAAFELFMPDGNLADAETAICVNIVAMCALIMAFPNAINRKDENAKKIFFSGISTLFKDSMLTIVRMIQLTNDTDDRCEIVILHSDYYSKQDPKALDDNYATYFNDVLKTFSSDGLRQHFIEMRDAATDFTERLGILIRMCAISEFPDKKWLTDPEKFKISFTEQCDYNRYDVCYGILDRIVRNYDTPSNTLYFNISPGTATVSALMTLMAIDGLRKLYYYISKKTNNETTKRSDEEKRLSLVELKKNEIPLHNLLSQALDSFEIEV